MIKKIIEEYKWLKFIEKHTKDIIEKEQTEIINVMLNEKMKFRNRIRLFLNLRLKEKFFVLIMFPLIVAFVEIAECFYSSWLYTGRIHRRK